MWTYGGDCLSTPSKSWFGLSLSNEEDSVLIRFWGPLGKTSRYQVDYYAGLPTESIMKLSNMSASKKGKGYIREHTLLKRTSDSLIDVLTDIQMTFSLPYHLVTPALRDIEAALTYNADLEVNIGKFEEPKPKVELNRGLSWGSWS